MRNLISITILFTLYLSSLFGQEAEKRFYNDGPYIFHAGNSLRIIESNEDGIQIRENVSKDTEFTVTSHSGNHQFALKLHDFERPYWSSEAPEKTMVISDPHGNLEAFLSILMSQGVVNESYEWTFGKNHLMVIGDVLDRGNDVLPIYWLIYKLEEEARRVGGRVHFLLGNHEEIVLRNDLRYVEPKYTELAKELGVEYNTLLGEESELGRWLRTRNTIERIGDNLFVHAGLSKDFLDQNWSIEAVNDTVSSYLGMSRDERKKSVAGSFLLTTYGPLWYRGMVKGEKHYKPISDEDVVALLNRYGVKRIYVGHTIFGDVTEFYGGKVVGVNVNNAKNMKESRTRGVLIQNGERYLIYDDVSKNRNILPNE